MREFLSPQQVEPPVTEGRVTHINYTATAKSIWQEGEVKALLSHHSGSSMGTFRTTTTETQPRDWRTQYHVLAGAESSTR